MKSFRSILILCYLTLAGGFCAFGQTFSAVRQYDVKAGISDNTVRTIVQDHTGHLWFGTKDGINRFNGSTISRFGSYPRTSDQPLFNILKLCPHTNNRQLWVATVDGLYLFDTIEGTFDFFDKKTIDNKGVASVVNDVCYDATGALWIATSKGLFCYEEKEDALRYYHSGDQKGSLPSNTVICILRDSSGDMWFGTRSGLAYYRRGVDKFASYCWTRKNMSSLPYEIGTLMETSEGDIWIGTRYDGLMHLDRTSGLFTSYPIIGTSEGNTWVRAIHQLDSNTFLIGTEDGLFVFDHSTKKITHQPALGTESIYDFITDREGGLWIGTYFAGAYYISPQSNNMHWYREGTSALHGSVVSQFCEDSNGNLWIATENGGLNHFNTTTRQFANYKSTGRPHDVSHNNIHALMLNGNYLWIGTFSKGVDVMDVRTRKVVKNYQRRKGSAGSLPHNYVYSIYKTRSGEIFVGTMLGFCKYIPQSDSFYTYEQMKNIFVYDMIEDEEGNLWIASKDNGVWRLKDNTFTNYTHDPESKVSLGNNHVIRTHIDERGQLWFATEGGGISRYNYQDDTFTNFNHNRGLHHHIIYGILDDEDGNLWLSSNYGIVRYNPDSQEQVVYTHEDGLQSNLFNYRSSFKASDGRFYFGGVNGFNCFYPDKFHYNNIRPTASIDNIVIFKRSSEQEIIRVKNQQEIEIKPLTSSFEINFDCLSFVSPSKNKYAYKVDKLHYDWVYTDKPSVTFMDLPAGHYRFMVKVANNDGVWSENECYVDLDIRAPLWKTTFAKILYIIVAVALCLLILWRYLTWQRKQQERDTKELEVAMQQEIYRSKIEFFTHVAHEIKTPLTLIKAPLEVIIEEGRWGEDTLENLQVMQQNTDRLLELIKQLLNFRKIDKRGYCLSYGDVNINDFIRQIVKRFDSSQRNIEIGVTLPEQPLLYRVDSEALTKIVSNLLANGLKYASKRIEIRLSEVMVGKQPMLQMQVADDGPGVTDTELARIFEPFYRSNNSTSENGFGIGLSLVKLLVDKHGGTITAGRCDRLGGFMLTITLPQGPTAQIEKIAPSSDVADNEDDSLVDNIEHDCNLLVVEDTEEMLDFLVKNLGYHFNVFGAKNGRKALEILEKQAIDVIISDIVMPEMDGFELLHAVRSDKILCHIPVVLLSAQANVNSKITGLDYGADAYIEKPFSLHHIKATIDNLLKSRKVLFDRFASMPSLEYGKGELKKHDSDWLERVNSIITRNFTNDKFSVDMLAAEMALSRSNLRRKLKGVTGLSPIDYIRLVRLKSAALLLKEGKHRVNEVCYMVGFQNHSYFARCFQKQFGMLPKDYMKD